MEYEIAEARYNEIKLTKQVNEVAMASGAVTPTRMSLDPAELAKQLKDEMDKIKFRFAEEKLKVIKLEHKVCVVCIMYTFYLTWFNFRRS